MDDSLVTGLGSVNSIKAVHPREHMVIQVKLQQGRHVALNEVDPGMTQRESIEERRKTCRRIHQQKVLIELRTGVDRRHHNLRAGDMVEHIDETA
jgi:hypothetical protein